MDIATLAAVVAALAAVASAAAIVWQTRCTTSIQAILQLLAAWDAPPMFPRIRYSSSVSAHVYLTRLSQHRVTAYASTPAPDIEAETSTAHIDSILDFFETVASMTQRNWFDWGRPLSFKQSYDSFYWPMACYWVAIEEYVASCQTSEGANTWREYSNLMVRFLKKELAPDSGSALKYFDDESVRAGIDASA